MKKLVQSKTQSWKSAFDRLKNLADTSNFIAKLYTQKTILMKQAKCLNQESNFLYGN